MVLLFLFLFRLSRHDSTVRLRSQSRLGVGGIIVLYVGIISARILYVPDDGFGKSRNMYYNIE